MLIEFGVTHKLNLNLVKKLQKSPSFYKITNIIIMVFLLFYIYKKSP